MRAGQEGDEPRRAGGRGGRRQDERARRAGQGHERGDEQRPADEDDLEQDRVEREHRRQQVAPVADERRVAGAQDRGDRRRRRAGQGAERDEDAGRRRRAAEHEQRRQPGGVPQPERDEHAHAGPVDQPPEQRRGRRGPERERAGHAARHGERPRLRAQEEHERERVDPDRQPREHRDREQRRQARQGEDGPERRHPPEATTRRDRFGRAGAGLARVGGR